MPYIMTVVSLFTADTALKYSVEKGWIKTGEIGKTVIVKKYHNKGAMMNIGAKQQQLIAKLSLALSAFVTGIFTAVSGKKGKKMLKTGLALILGGAYSNTFDRLRKGYVVDYVSFHINTEKCGSEPLKKFAEKFSSIVFNFADLGIIMGAILSVLGGLDKGQD